jgi:hypothetical protein
MAKMIKHLPAGFVIPAQPILASKPASGADWVHEIKHDGYRIIVRTSPARSCRFWVEGPQSCQRRRAAEAEREVE